MKNKTTTYSFTCNLQFLGLYLNYYFNFNYNLDNIVFRVFSRVLEIITYSIVSSMTVFNIFRLSSLVAYWNQTNQPILPLSV